MYELKVFEPEKEKRLPVAAKLSVAITMANDIGP
jgi:hypothetical protein